MPMISISRSLELPHGFQRFEDRWFSNGLGTKLNAPAEMISCLKENPESTFYLYTQHLIFRQDGLLKQTRSSPNWEGGLTTYATCKHNMRTYREQWEDVWIGGLCPSHCANNCLLFVGRVDRQFDSNLALGEFVRDRYASPYTLKQANSNPRGDLYKALGTNSYSHCNYEEPKGHTRSVEFYDKSPGSISQRPDGKVPKWWRDVEYLYRDRRPPCFILNPCWLFSKPMLWSVCKPGRAALKMELGEFGESLRKKPSG